MSNQNRKPYRRIRNPKDDEVIQGICAVIHQRKSPHKHQPKVIAIMADHEHEQGTLENIMGQLEYGCCDYSLSYADIIIRKDRKRGQE